MTAIERRKRYLVEKKFQLKPVYIITVAFILIILAIEWQIYSFLKTVLPNITLMETRTEILHFGVSLMIQLFIILFVIGILIVVHLHRFVGPLKRLRKELDAMAETDQYHLLALRKNDTLREFVNSINRIISKLMK